jgi:hypothetical protein
LSTVIAGHWQVAIAGRFNVKSLEEEDVVLVLVLVLLVLVLLQLLRLGQFCR